MIFCAAANWPLPPSTMTRSGRAGKLSSSGSAGAAEVSGASSAVSAQRMATLTRLASRPDSDRSPLLVVATSAAAMQRTPPHTPLEAQIDPRVIRRIRMADKMSAVDLWELQTHRRRLIAAINDRLGDAILICPTTPSVAMPIAALEADVEEFFHHNFRTLRNTALGNFLDWCGIAIPNGADGDGMPTSLMLSARHGRDRQILSAGLALESAIRG